MSTNQAISNNMKKSAFLFYLILSISTLQASNKEELVNSIFIVSNPDSISTSCTDVATAR